MLQKELMILFTLNYLEKITNDLFTNFENN